MCVDAGILSHSVLLSVLAGIHITVHSSKNTKVTSVCGKRKKNTETGRNVPSCELHCCK